MEHAHVKSKKDCFHNKNIMVNISVSKKLLLHLLKEIVDKTWSQRWD